MKLYILRTSAEKPEDAEVLNIDESELEGIEHELEIDPSVMYWSESKEDIIDFIYGRSRYD